MVLHTLETGNVNMANLPYPNSYLGIPEEEQTLTAPDGTPVQVSVPVGNPVMSPDVDPLQRHVDAAVAVRARENREMQDAINALPPQSGDNANRPALPPGSVGQPSVQDDALPEAFEPQSAVTPTQQEYDTASQYSRELARSGNETAAEDAQREVDAYAGAGSQEGQMAKRTVSAQGEMMDAQAQAIGTQTEKARGQLDAVQQYKAGVQARLQTAAIEAETINAEAQKAGQDVARQVAEDQEAMRKNRDQNPFFSNTSLADGIGLALSLAIGNWHARKTGSENMAVKILQQRIGQAVQTQEAERADLVKAYDRNVARYDQIEADRVRNQQTLEYKTAMMISAAEEKFNEQLAGIDQSALDQEQLDNIAEISAFFKGAKADSVNQAVGMASARKAEEAKMALAMAKSRGSGGGGGGPRSEPPPDIVDQIFGIDIKVEGNRAKRDKLLLELKAADPETYKTVQQMVKDQGQYSEKELDQMRVKLFGETAGMAADPEIGQEVKRQMAAIEQQADALRQLRVIMGDDELRNLKTAELRSKLGSGKYKAALAQVSNILQIKLDSTSFEEGPNGIKIIGDVLGIGQDTLDLQSFNADVVSMYLDGQMRGIKGTLAHQASLTKRQEWLWDKWMGQISAKTAAPASKEEREEFRNKEARKSVAKGDREGLKKATDIYDARLRGNPADPFNQANLDAAVRARAESGESAKSIADDMVRRGVEHINDPNATTMRPTSDDPWTRATGMGRGIDLFESTNARLEAVRRAYNLSPRAGESALEFRNRGRKIEMADRLKNKKKGK